MRTTRIPCISCGLDPKNNGIIVWLQLGTLDILEMASVYQVCDTSQKRELGLMVGIVKSLGPTGRFVDPLVPMVESTSI